MPAYPSPLVTDEQPITCKFDSLVLLLSTDMELMLHDHWSVVVTGHLQQYLHILLYAQMVTDLRHCVMHAAAHR